MRDLATLLEDLAMLGEPRGADAVFRAARSVVPSRRLVAPHTPRRKVAFVIALVIVVVIAGGLALVLDRSRSGPTVDLPVVTPSPLRDLFDTSDKSAPPGVRYLIPGFVPDGMQPVRIQGGDQPELSTTGGPMRLLDASRMQLWARLSPEGSSLESFTIRWGPGDVAYNELQGGSVQHRPFVDPLESARRDGTPVEVRGVKGFLLKDSVSWEEPKGQRVDVYGASLDDGELLAIANSLERRSDDGFTATRAPTGFVQIGESSGATNEVTNPREIDYRGAGSRGFRVEIGDAPGATPGTNLVGPPGTKTTHVITVRGRHGIVADTLTNGGNGTDTQTRYLRGMNRFVQWLEPGNVMVTVGGVGLEESELIAIANGLTVVPSTTWDEYLVRAPGRIGPPASRTVAPVLTGEEIAVADAYRKWFDTPTVDAIAFKTEGGDGLRSAISALPGKVPVAPYTINVQAVRLVGPDHALVTFTLFTPYGTYLPDTQGGAVMVDGRWLVSRATFCGVVAIVGVECPVR